MLVVIGLLLTAAAATAAALSCRCLSCCICSWTLLALGIPLFAELATLKRLFEEEEFEGKKKEKNRQTKLERQNA